MCAESEVAESVVRAADDEVHDGTVTRLVGPFPVGILDPPGRDVLDELLRDGLALVDGLHLPSPDDLEIQARPAAVDASVLIGAVPPLLRPPSLVLVALGCRESAFRLEMQDLFLCFHFSDDYRVIYPFFSVPQLAAFSARG